MVTSTGAVGPSLANMGNVAATRKPGMTAAQYLTESIVNTNAYIVPGYQPNLMPQTYSALPPNEVADLVAFLLTQKSGQ